MLKNEITLEELKYLLKNEGIESSCVTSEMTNERLRNGAPKCHFSPMSLQYTIPDVDPVWNCLKCGHTRPIAKGLKSLKTQKKLIPLKRHKTGS